MSNLLLFCFVKIQRAGSSKQQFFKDKAGIMAICCTFIIVEKSHDKSNPQ